MMPSNKGKYQPVGVGMTPCKNELGRYVRARRIELDIRQVSLAKKCGFIENFVSQVEIGICKYLSDCQLKRLAMALQCDPEELRKRIPVKRVAQPKTELGKLIRSRREELGLSLQSFARKMRISPQKAKFMELSQSQTTRYGSLKTLAIALDLDLSKLARFAIRINKESKSSLGNMIRTRRRELGMSTKQLADKLDVTYQFVSQIELGQCRLAENDELIAKLAVVLMLDEAELNGVRPKRRLKQVVINNTLGGFLAAKRLNLRLTQREVSEKVETTASVISGIERGLYYPTSYLLDRLAKTLDCEIPVELVPSNQPKKSIVRTTTVAVVRLSDQNLSDLERIRELSDIRTKPEVVRKALKILRCLLEKQSEGYTVCLGKEGKIVELELLL